MTMTYCRSCQRDVHITHKADECDGCEGDKTPHMRTPSGCRP